VWFYWIITTTRLTLLSAMTSPFPRPDHPDAFSVTIETMRECAHAPWPCPSFSEMFIFGSEIEFALIDHGARRWPASCEKPKVTASLADLGLDLVAHGHVDLAH
jgi:hypothetical protein